MLSTDDATRRNQYAPEKFQSNLVPLDYQPNATMSTKKFTHRKQCMAFKFAHTASTFCFRRHIKADTVHYCYSSARYQSASTGNVQKYVKPCLRA